MLRFCLHINVAPVCTPISSNPRPVVHQSN